MPDYGHGKPDSETLPLLSSRFKKKRREGAEQAWLYHSAGLWGLICHWNGTRNAIFRRETLEDILQETCLAFTGNAMSGNIKYRQGDLGPYLRTIALFKFVDVLRRHKRDQAINVDIAWEEVAAGEGDDPTVPASAVRWNQILRDILRYCDDKKLPHRRRTVLKAATIWFAANGCWPPIPKLTDLINADPDQKGELTKRQVSYAFNEALVGLAKHLKDKGYRD